DRARDGSPVHDGAAREQRMARGLARRGVHELPDGLVLRDARRRPRVRRARALDPVARFRALEPARVAGERAIPRLLDLQLDDLFEGAAVLRGDTLRVAR